LGIEAAREIGPHLLWAALVAGLVACGVPLLQGVVGGWSPTRIIAYIIMATVFLLLTQSTGVPALLWLCLRNKPLYLALAGAVCFVLQAISGDGFIQPIAFTVPFVSAVMWFGDWRGAMVGAAYLLLQAAGLWISEQADVGSIGFSVASYGALMFFMFNSTRMVVRESSARQRADQLAAALAHERTNLQRLTTINATLARDLDLLRVLEHVAEAGRTLTRAGQVRLWLRESEPPDERALHLAIEIPLAHGESTTGENQAGEIVAPPFSDAPTATPGEIVFPLFAKGREIGVLELRQPSEGTFGAGDLDLLQPFADAAALAIENAQLYERVQLSAVLTERNRLARELHDTIAQGLTAVTMHLEAAQRSWGRDPVRTRQRVARAHELSRTTLDDVRRSVWTLAAPLIDGASLDTALHQLTQDWHGRTSIAATYTRNGAVPRLGHAAATQALRIAQEALQNVEKHAHASSVAVELATSARAVVVRVRDNGVGFVHPDPAARLDAGGNGFGLHSLRERARIAGGELHVTSAPGAGTSVELVISLPADQP
jgi:signal transduction histidine kinase